MSPLTLLGTNVPAVILLLFFNTPGINVPEGGLKSLEKMKRLGMSKIPSLLLLLLFPPR